jgi:hypothetical protein
LKLNFLKSWNSKLVNWDSGGRIIMVWPCKIIDRMISRQALELNCKGKKAME